jgi:hypothetical protein
MAYSAWWSTSGCWALVQKKMRQEPGKMRLQNSFAGAEVRDQKSDISKKNKEL